MLIERQAMKAELEQCRRQMHALREQHESFLKQSVVISACSHGNISDRAATTYLNIIGGMLTLMLGPSPAGKASSSFRTQESVVSALVAYHQCALGIPERTLHAKFASANPQLP